MRLGRLISVLALALATALGAQPASAQQRIRAARQAGAQAFKQGTGPRRGNANKPAQGSDRVANKPNGNGAGSSAATANGGKVARPPNEELFKPNPNVVRNLPPVMQQRLRDMSPQEQERFLQNNQRFQSLPPERQAQIRRNLERWNNLSPAEKDRLSHAEQSWERMTPEQRQLYQSQILPKWEQMSPDRRQLINGRLHTLQGMTPAQRDAALNDARFMQGLTPDEQGVLRNLNSLRGPRPQ